MVLLFSQPLKRSFHAPLCSCSTLFCSFILLVALILPYFIAFSTQDFWKKREVYFEQPKVLYRKELLVQVTSSSPIISGSSLTYQQSSTFYSTIGELNDLYYEELSPIILKSSTLNSNFDDFPEEHNFNLTLYTASEDIRNIKVLSFYDYQIREVIKMDLIGMAYIDLNTPLGAGSVTVDGTLNFKQRMPLKPSTTVRDEYNNSLTGKTSGLFNYIPSVLYRDNDRNFTTEFKYNAWVLPRGQKHCTLSIRLRVPTNEQFEYSPTFLEVMKFGWIQYQSILIPFALLFFGFASFVYSNQILEARVSNETKG